MRPVILLSVFLVVTYCCEALSEELIRQQPSQDFVKLTSSRKQIAKRRFRRDAPQYAEDPDVVTTNKAEGLCNEPTIEEGHGVTKMTVSKLWRALFIDEDSKDSRLCFFRFCSSNVDCSVSFLLVGV